MSSTINLFNITEGELGKLIQKIENGDDIDDNTCTIVDKYINNLPNNRKPRNGDCMCLVKNRYRNDGLLFWNNKTVLPDYDVDDYGAVPSCFNTLVDYNPKYWVDIVDHNYYIPVSKEIMSQMVILEYMVVPMQTIIKFTLCGYSGIGYCHKYKKDIYNESYLVACNKDQFDDNACDLEGWSDADIYVLFGRW